MSPTVTPPRPQLLRRTREGRVAAGVSGGLGDYFGVDPVLFRVLFATSAFFGGAGILAYLLAWLAIPEAGTERAAVDGWITALRRRRVPVWAVAVVGGLLLWAIAASWWAPGPPLAAIAVVAVIAAVLISRRQSRAVDAAPAVDLSKDPMIEHSTPPAESTTSEARAWVREAQLARRERIRRARPLKIVALVTLALVLTVLALVDAARGVQLQAYCWTTLGITLGTLLVGVVLRRTPWSLTWLLVPALAGAAAFGGSAARLHDGVGQRTWTPTAASGHYRLAVGQADLDLRSLTGPARVDVTMGAGEVRIVVPRDSAVTVDARVHIGRIEVDGQRFSDDGAGMHRVIGPPHGATGAPVAVHVQLADGRVRVEHR